MTVDVTTDQAERLQQLASESHRSPDELVQESVDRYLADEEATRAAILRGDEDIAAGRLLTSDDVRTRLEARLSTR